MDPRCKIELLGRLRVRQAGDRLRSAQDPQAGAPGGREITRFQTRKTAALLAYLAFYRDRMHPREVLVALLWPDSDIDLGRNSLSKALSSLRHQLEPPGVPAGAVIHADRACVGFNTAFVATDVDEFEDALEAVAPTRSSGERLRQLAEAVEVYGGDLLPGFYEEWIPPERHRLKEAFLLALRELASEQEATGDLERALAYASRAVSADPVREEARRDLMHLLAAAGQPSAALGQYRELERLLKEELDRPPGAATRALAQKLELQAAGSMDVRTYGRTDEEPRSGPSSTRPGPAVAGAPHTSTPLPTGTVTFLLVEIEGATVHRERSDGGAGESVQEYHAVLQQQLRRHGGHGIQVTAEEGDPNTEHRTPNTEHRLRVLLLFGRASDAIGCAVDAYHALASLPRGGDASRVRMALNAGETGLPSGSAPALQDTTLILRAGHAGQILCSESAAVLARSHLPPGVALVDLGPYRLRREEAPVRLFQVEWPREAQGPFPPLRAEAGYNNNLPPDFTRFFGREEQIAQLREMLAPGGRSVFGVRCWDEPDPDTEHRTPNAEHRLVTLTGPGGSGKTRLALEFARRLLEVGAVWFVPLQEISDGRLVVQAIHDSLRLPKPAGVDGMQQVVEALGRQPALLLLDSFEQLVQDGAALVRTLLEHAPALTCLVTSRQRLDIAGEQVFPVPPLPIPAAIDSPKRRPATSGPEPSELIGCDSVRLFVDRAQAVRPDFQVTRSNAGAVATICERLEGIPLAIELAAARIQALTPAQMVAHLAPRTDSQVSQPDEIAPAAGPQSGRFDLLVTRRRDAPARHRSLWAAMDWSYQLLSPELRRFFASLSVFRGGWTVEAASAIADCGLRIADCPEEAGRSGQPERGEAAPRSQSAIRPPVDPLRGCPRVPAQSAMDTLDALEQLRECSLILAEEVGSPPEIRFRMLDTLREYAAGRLTSQQSALLARRHTAHFLELAEQAERELFGPLQSAWLERLAAEQENFRAALARSLEQPADPAVALRLAGALGPFWRLRGLPGAHSEGRRWLDRALSAAERGGPRAYPEGTAAEHEHEHEHERERWAWRARALQWSGALSFGDEARRFLEQSLAIWEEIGDRRGAATSLGYLGTLAHLTNRFTEARDLHERSLAVWRELTEPWGIAWALGNLGWMAYRREDCAAARSLLEESLTLRRAIPDQPGIALSLNLLGDVAHTQGDHATAALFHQESLAIYRELGDRWEIVGSLRGLGRAAYARGDDAAARLAWEERLAVQREGGNRWGIAMALTDLGKVAQRQGDYPTARAMCREGLDLWQGMGHRESIAYSLAVFAGLIAAEGSGVRRQASGVRRQASGRSGSGDPKSKIENRKSKIRNRAAQLLGAAEALHDTSSDVFQPADRLDWEHLGDELRAELGAEAYAAARAGGASLTLEEAIALALQE